MLASSLINLSLTNSLALEHERAEALEDELIKRRQMTEDEFAHECQFKMQQMKKIAQTFVDIRNMMLAYEKNETLGEYIYQDLKKSINHFESRLISEVATGYERSHYPLSTALKLEETVRSTFSVKNTLEDKAKSLTEFRNYARNAKLSVASKCAIGAVVGGLATSAAFVGMIACGGALSLLGGPLGLGIFISAILFFAIYGALSGTRIALKCSENQDDSRGYGVHKKLNTLMGERNKFFQVKKCLPEVSTKTLVCSP